MVGTTRAGGVLEVQFDCCRGYVSRDFIYM